ncbi:MAG: hypothetical protein ABSG83_04070 [Roseiarcus sp.]|jgi:hypothetical protein
MPLVPSSNKRVDPPAGIDLAGRRDDLAGGDVANRFADRPFLAHAARAALEPIG